MRSRSESTCLLIAAVLLASGCGGAKAEPDPVQMAVTSHAKSEIAWEKDWDAAFMRARSQGRPVMANFYADWCVWCKTLETITFRDQKVAALLAERVVPLNIDIDGDAGDVVSELHVEAPPTIVFLDPDGNELGRIPGYLPPTQFITVVEKILAGEPVTFG